MDDRSSTQSFPNLHHHRPRPSFHLTLAGLQSPEAGYPSSQSALDTLGQYGSRGEESSSSFPTPGASSEGKRGSRGGLDGDANLGGHLDGNSGLGSHFADTWYNSVKKEDVWEDGESCESTTDNFYNKGDCYSNANDVCYAMNCGNEEGLRRKVKANYNNYAHISCEARNETSYSRLEADVGHFTKQTTSYTRSTAGSCGDSSVDYFRTDSRVSDNYLGREEDYGSSCGSGEDQLHPTEVEGPWLSTSPSSQAGDSRWRGAADTHALPSGCPPQRSPISISGGTYTQKLDSFSEAFLSHRKGRFPAIASGDPSGQIWEFGLGRGDSPGLVKSRHSCAFDSDSYLPPSSSSSPAHPSLPSFPSPPTSSHPMPSVLSPPPTPLPPPSHSPSKMDSPGAFGGTGHSMSQGGEPLGMLQFFTSRLHPPSSVHSPGMIWKFPLLPHCFPQSSGDPSNIEGDLRSSHGSDYGNITASQDVLQSPESSFLASSSHHPVRALGPSSTSSLQHSFHLPSRPTYASGQQPEAAEKTAAYVVTQKVKNGPATLNQSQPQQPAFSVYTGTPFPSTLHSSRGQKKGHYTPRPLLNPARRGKGLYSSLSSVHHSEGDTPRVEQEDVLPHVNVGHDFQAELPPCFMGGKGSEVWSLEEKSPWEQLLWKPRDTLEESTDLQDQVEKLLSMCSSSCVPGGGSNTELALHCLHYCQGNTKATLEMLLFSQPSPAGDYHYSGSDFWTDSEKSLFSAALGTYGKEFSLIQKMVRTKTVCQCVEFYYLGKKLLDKQKKQREEEKRDGEMEQQKSITPICQPVDSQFGLEEAVPVPALANFFPCKLCGKMFYKIKSRNAHMKIHRQPQEDWTERKGGCSTSFSPSTWLSVAPPNLMPTPVSSLLPPQVPARTFSSCGLPGTPSSGANADSVLSSVTSSNVVSHSNASVLEASAVVTYSNVASLNSHAITNVDGTDPNQREPTTVLPFHQSWGSFGHDPDPATFYCSTEGKDGAGAGTVGGKEPINWQ
ncbi:hypothetical protein L3Q82_016963 [Scortum barcoo]|uniref:Uncharacterized protein n=1 Tax=Scortum barcoo TaxID=214431 RepID=A0ACB8X950_9TELE|nr:hypothetical protein L3Q82_016963 [Scortum barcoo]